MRAYAGPMKDKRQSDLTRLVRIAGSQRKLADALETTEETVSRWANGSRKVPPYVSVVLELLEGAAPNQWPARWR